MNNIIPLEVMVMSDIRKGLTSASSFADDRECLGRRMLINSLPPEYLKPESDEYAEFGTAVHKALETGNLVNLDEEQYETYKAIMAGEEQLLNEWTLNNDLEVISKWGREERFWLTDESGNQIGSAQLDRYWISAPHALIIDVKSLFAPHLPRAEFSWQLRFQAVCLWVATGCDRIRAAYNSPNKYGRKLDWHDFTLEDLKRDLAEIRHVCWQMAQPHSPRTPGNSCRYCAARGVCPEAAAYAMLPSVVAQTSLANTKAEIQQRVSMLTPADWVFIWQRAGMIKNITDAASACLKALGDEGLNPLGLRLGKGRTTTEIPNDSTKQACEILAGLGLSEDDLWKCVSVDKIATIARLAASLNISKAKATEHFEQNLATLIVDKTGEPILREI